MRFGPGAGGGGQGGLSERPPMPSRGAQASSPTPRPPPSVGLNSAVLCGAGRGGEVSRPLLYPAQSLQRPRISDLPCTGQWEPRELALPPPLQSTYSECVFPHLTSHHPCEAGSVTHRKMEALEGNQLPRAMELRALKPGVRTPSP